MSAALSTVRRTDPDDPEDGGKMSFLEHLEDLRKWNMAICAAPMLCLYLIGIGVACLAELKRRSNDAGLHLVFTAAILDHAWKQQMESRPYRR